jgi:hypothetical protein
MKRMPPPEFTKHQVTIVALSKYPDIFSGFNDNMNKFDEGHNRVLIKDGGLITDTRGWMTVEGPYEFSMAGNANLGWKTADKIHDILYIGDDVRFIRPDTINYLRIAAYSDPSVGLLSPKIKGGADNPLQTNPESDENLIYSERYLALVCTYIKREVLNAVGYLDEETFKGYGWEDVDYSRRVKQHGFRLAIAPNIEVTHGLARSGTETFIRNDKGYTKVIYEQSKANEAAFLKKWGDTNK